jgi:hypothetical protein
MAAAVTPRTRKAPGLYRWARLFRRLSAVVLILLVVFLATAGYSAIELVRSSPQSGGYSAAFEANDTIGLTGSLRLSNPGFYSVSGFSLNLRIENTSGIVLGDVTEGPETLAAQSTTSFPIALYLPITPSGPAASLLTTDQNLLLGVWGNATFADVFPVSVHFDENKSWGAPFSDFLVQVGTPTVTNGTAAVPVTISFSNHASFSEVGTLEVVLRSSAGVACGGGGFVLSVAPNDYFYQTQNIDLGSGCSLVGGSADAVFTGSGATIPLPPEALP